MKNHPTTEDPTAAPPLNIDHSRLPLRVVELNRQALSLLNAARSQFAVWSIQSQQIAGAEAIDFRSAACPNEAGILLAQVSGGGQLDVALEPAVEGAAWQWDVVVQTNAPAATCLGAQYAGWPLSCGKYFAMVSGPIRGARGREPIFNHFSLDAAAWREHDDVKRVAVLESDHLPDEATVQQIATESLCRPDQLVLCVAGTASPAGTLQVVARSLETSLHQCEVLGGDIGAIHAGTGRAPLPPIPKKSLTAIGWTNDAIIYHGQAAWQVSGDWETWQQLGSQVSSENSPSFGQPFLTLFKAANYDFYKLDPRLFAPAIIEIHHVATQQHRRFGSLHPELLSKSWSE
ncbi:MAG: methenyltetrahydromethanopterin cyclohydrolase [Planctomycetaceae bacterium]|nr:methenyltetrahydromethanopterin cyclohydrolase [Planctomycetaceae bacterium]